MDLRLKFKKLKTTPSLVCYNLDKIYTTDCKSTPEELKCAKKHLPLSKTHGKMQPMDYGTISTIG